MCKVGANGKDVLMMISAREGGRVRSPDTEGGRGERKKSRGTRSLQSHGKSHGKFPIGSRFGMPQ